MNNNNSRVVLMVCFCAKDGSDDWQPVKYVPCHEDSLKASSFASREEADAWFLENLEEDPYFWEGVKMHKICQQEEAARLYSGE